MSMGGGQTVQNNDPWSGAQPYLRDIMNQAMGLYHGGTGGASGSLSPGMLAAYGYGSGGGGGGGYSMPQYGANSGGLFGSGQGSLGGPLSGQGTGQFDLGTSLLNPGGAGAQFLGMPDPLSGFVGNILGSNNRPAIGDIADALSRGKTISDASWAEAGYGPGGIAKGSKPVAAATSGEGAATGGATPQSAPGATDPYAVGSYADKYPELSDTTQYALGRISDRGATGSPLLQTAQNTVQNFAGGGATNNPYLDQMFGRAADQVRDYTNAGATMAGRRGSGANQDILGKNIGDLAAQMYGGAYESGQNRQLAAAQMAPNLANQDFVQLQQLLGAGQMYDTQNLNKYNAPWDILSKYSGAVTGMGSMGGTKTQTAPSQSAFPSLIAAAAPYLLSLI